MEPFGPNPKRKIGWVSFFVLLGVDRFGWSTRHGVSLVLSVHLERVRQCIRGPSGLWFGDTNLVWLGG
jgi:hypothetical protein